MLVSWLYDEPASFIAGAIKVDLKFSICFKELHDLGHQNTVNIST